ncbi:ornithine carbamoyltransferase [Irineochytrium annulatum]|nr:ornithine carbamoyltransferase [Irineochytrium annulatum]
MKHFLTLRDQSATDILKLIRRSLELKAVLKTPQHARAALPFSYDPALLRGRSLAILFTKRSTRTRLSAETAWAALGGHPIFLGKDDIQLGAGGESWRDTATVVSSMADGILARVGAHKEVELLAEHASCPVVNALTAKYHPLQILADVMTLYEAFAPDALAVATRSSKAGGPPLPPLPKGLKVAWVGDGNNILNSLLVTLPRLGVHLNVATPKGYAVDAEVLDYARSTAPKLVSVDPNPAAAVASAHVIVTDTWVSMGQEEEKRTRLEAFKGYRVTEEMARSGGADSDWKFMHCLPRKQEEVDDEVFYSEKRSLVFPEAENRKYTVMSVFESPYEVGGRGHGGAEGRSGDGDGRNGGGHGSGNWRDGGDYGGRNGGFNGGGYNGGGGHGRAGGHNRNGGGSGRNGGGYVGGRYGDRDNGVGGSGRGRGFRGWNGVGRGDSNPPINENYPLFEIPNDIAPEPKVMSVVAKSDRLARAVLPGFMPRRVASRNRLGQEIQLAVNMYDITHRLPPVIFRYEIRIVAAGAGGELSDERELPELIARKVFRLWVTVLVEKGLGVAALLIFDGVKMVFSPCELANVPVSSTIVLQPNRHSNLAPRPGFRVDLIGEPAALDTAVIMRYIRGQESDLPRDALQAIDVLLLATPKNSSELAAFAKRASNAAFFAVNDEPTPLGSGTGNIGVLGWKQAVKVTERGLRFNVDIAATAFRRADSLENHVRDVRGVRNIRDLMPGNPAFDRLATALEGLLITINYRGSGRLSYRIIGLGPRPQFHFIDVGGQRKSVAQYLYEAYGARVDPNLPLVEVRGKRSAIDKTYVPLDFCTVKEGQRVMGKLDQRQVDAMLRMASLQPRRRMEKIEEGRRKLFGGAIDNELLKGWSTKVDDQLVKVSARRLQEPRMTMPNDRFPHPAPLLSFAVAVFSDRIGLGPVRDAIGAIFQACRRQGMNIQADAGIPSLYVMQRGLSVAQRLMIARRQALGVRRDEATPQDRKPDLIFCVIESTADYAEVKRVAETQLGLLTQCLLAEKLRVTKAGYTKNLALKVNAKLGGVNRMLHAGATMTARDPTDGSTRPSKTLLLGADVTHPAPNTSEGSIVGVTGTIDGTMARFRGILQAQPARQEAISELGDLVRRILFNVTERVDRAVFFRDGLGENQFRECAEEIESLRKILSPHNIKLTYLVVSKRHPVRFFAENARDADQNGNLHSGTIIDHDVTSPNVQNFYLYSHKGLQGTSKPAHYYVLYDENDFSNSDLQELSYATTFLSARATGPVSLPASVYFAHLLAARARTYRADVGLGTGANEVASYLEPLEDILDKMFFA